MRFSLFVKPTLLLVLFVAAACAAPEEPSPATVGKRGDLIVTSRELPADVTLAAVGLAPDGDRRDGASEWDSSFHEGTSRHEPDGVRRPFTVTLLNRSATARDFHARLDYVAPDGRLIRRKTLTNLVVPPFTEVVTSGSVMLPRPGDAEVVARIIPATEAFEDDGDR